MKPFNPSELFPAFSHFGNKDIQGPAPLAENKGYGIGPHPIGGLCACKHVLVSKDIRYGLSFSHSMPTLNRPGFPEHLNRQHIQLGPYKTRLTLWQAMQRRPLGSYIAESSLK